MSEINQSYAVMMLKRGGGQGGHLPPKFVYCPEDCYTVLQFLWVLLKLWPIY